MSRELLKEAAQALETVQHYFPAQDEADKGLAVADVDACQRLMTKIEAYLAEPEPDVELASDTEYGFVARYGSLTADGKTKDEAMQELARVILAAFNSAPEPDAMEVVEKLRLGGYALNANDPDDRGPNGDDYHFTFSKAEAAALIADYGRRVPRVMLEELAIEILNLADLTWKSGWQEYVKNLLTAIFAKHGVKMEG